MYEFDLSNLTIRDYLLLSRYSNSTNDPKALEEFINLGAKVCDFDPLDLPWSELDNFVTQLAEALVISFRKPDTDNAEG